MTNLLTVDWSTLPAPQDDGAARHLIGLQLPSIELAATQGGTVDLSIQRGRSVVYAYPMTGKPDVPLPDGWDMLPGARGCTPQSCAFRDHAAELRAAGADHIFGLSTQTTAYQQEAAERLHLPFSLLSDASLALTQELKLPTLIVDGMTLTKRLTMVVQNGRIEYIFYPVFPPDQNAADVVQWLAQNTV
jgi:peroxiredoxin